MGSDQTIHSQHVELWADTFVCTTYLQSWLNKSFLMRLKVAKFHGHFHVKQEIRATLHMVAMKRAVSALRGLARKKTPHSPVRIEAGRAGPALHHYFLGGMNGAALITRPLFSSTVRLLRVCESERDQW